MRWLELGMYCFAVLGFGNASQETNVCYSSVVLWVSQNMEDEYAYNLSL